MPLEVAQQRGAAAQAAGPAAGARTPSITSSNQAAAWRASFLDRLLGPIRLVLNPLCRALTWCRRRGVVDARVGGGATSEAVARRGAAG